MTIHFLLPGGFLKPRAPVQPFVPPATPRTSTTSASAQTKKVPDKEAPEVKAAGDKQRRTAAARQGFRGNIRTSARGTQDEADTKRKTLLGS